jgi:phosphoglucomutase/phosphomannomutase
VTVLSEEAAKNVQAWLEGPYDIDTKDAIRKMMVVNVPETENAFYSYLSFGTGGMRGLMGIGPNRMNLYTVRQTTRGLADYLKKAFPKTPLKVVIGFDSRNNSKMFAQEAARVLAAASIQAFIFKELRPTPLVSFACRHLGCHAGIMITASHNPPEYNGYKVYWADGGQVLPPHDKGILAEIEKVRAKPNPVPVTPEQDPFIQEIGKEVDEAYLAAIKPLSLWPDMNKSTFLVMYSPLHGTGGTLMPQALLQYGFENVKYVKEQMIADGSFPTAHVPNPEDKGALKMGIEAMLQKSCNIFLATDPDADRLGAVVNHKDEAVILTGNQIAALLAEWILLRLKEQDKMPAHPTLVKTIVTSPLIEKIAREYGASIAEVLTGFKYIAQKMNEWEKDPDHQFIFGCEESYGYLYGTYARDKDGILCGCLLAEIAWYFKRKGKTLVDALEDLWKRYGYFEESTSTCIFSETKSGRDKMAEVMKSLRTKPPETFGEYKCILFEDLLTKQFKGDPKLRVGESLPQSDVLIFTLEGNSKIIVRPSGTEPKVKIYYMLTAATEGQDLTQVKIATKNKSDQLKRIMKDIVG